MKKALFSLLILGSFTAHAEDLSCPVGSETLVTCVEATQSEDHVVAVEFMSGAVVCTGQNGPVMFMNVGGKSSPAFPVHEIARSGATAYTGGDDELQFSLVRKTVGASQPANSTFSMALGEGADQVRVSRSLQCD